MSELIPCPFCGGEARKSGERFENTILSWVYCLSCGAAGGYQHTEAEAIEAWNTRAERTCENVSKWKDERLECSECGCITDYVSYEDEPYMMTDEGATIPSYCPNCGSRVIA